MQEGLLAGFMNTSECKIQTSGSRPRIKKNVERRLITTACAAVEKSKATCCGVFFFGDIRWFLGTRTLSTRKRLCGYVGL